MSTAAQSKGGVCLCYNTHMNSFSLDWAMRRRIIIVLIVIAFFAVIGGIYSFINRPIPSCFDKIQNQNEEGMDCGGVCSLQCSAKSAKLEVRWTKAIRVREGMYDIAALVEYPAGNTAIPRLDYTAKLFDSTGGVLAERHGSTFVNPSDHFLVYEGGVQVSATATRAEVTLDPTYDTLRASSSPVTLTVLSRDLSSPDAHPRLSAVIRNDTNTSLRNVPVNAIVSDGSGPVAVAGTVIDSLPAKSSKLAQFTWPESLSYQATEACSVPVDAMLVLDRSGSMKDDDKIGGAKAAAADFAKNLNANDQAGFVSFATHASTPVDHELTLDKTVIASTIASSSIHTDGLQYTNMMEAFDAARGELTSGRARKNASKVVIFLTDGEPTYPKNPEQETDKQYPVQKGLDAAQAIKNLGITIYTIGLGKDLADWMDFMKTVSSVPENYFPAPSTKDLSGIYKNIATGICKKGPSVIEIIPRVDVFGSTNAPN